MTDDRHQIIEQLNRLAEALDQRDWAQIGDVFTADATAYRRHGTEAILATVRDHLGGCGPSQHLLGNHRVEVDGDAARSLTYARVYHRGAGEREDAFFECIGEYDDHWVRDGGVWRISSRAFTMSIQIGDFGVLQPG
ncbi:nuclear transport factor 2 family protein [Streptosporangium carneum]|uniref:SnoaL-like domain-containing protein n=1 Tax=Streptosporangium carneum TaxID=47481 RepID=A0A9W6HYB4_9ACTN|nr:nuclear transport factor 2 family protein [Streptosporangium carneum]GLK08580.1 hypothetical protein GCM10017600_19850 [Streptosporangium carneum]